MKTEVLEALQSVELLDGETLSSSDLGFELHMEHHVFQVERSHRPLSEAVEDLSQTFEIHQKLESITHMVKVVNPSPDTVLTYIRLWFKRFSVEGEGKEAFKPWTDYMRRWNAGDVRSTGKTERSWGNHIRALTHHNIEEGALRDNFKNAVRFTLECMEAKAQPAEIPVLNRSELYLQAQSMIKIESQEYQQLLQSSEQLQLSVPSSKSNRSVYVDALIVTDNRLLGSLPDFARNDSENSFFESGFGLMVVYRPQLSGSGNEVVISADPSLHIDLLKLQEALESRETLAWGKLANLEEDGAVYNAGCSGESVRPSENKRVYRDAKGNVGEYSYDQPWFISPDHTLVASPRKVKYKGSDIHMQLSWEEVIETTWQTFNPVKHLKVEPLKFLMKDDQIERDDSEKVSTGQSNFMKADRLMTLLARYQESTQREKGDASCSKKFIAVNWPIKTQTHNCQNGHDLDSVLLTPTAKRYFAAVLNKKDVQEVKLEELPLLSSFDFMEAPGSLGIIHKSGSLVIDDWSKDQGQVDAFANEYLNLLERYTQVSHYHSEVLGELQALKEKLNNTNDAKASHNNYSLRKQLVKSNRKLSSLKAELRTTILRTTASAGEYNVKRFRELTAERWGLDHQLADLYVASQEIETIINQNVEVRTSRLLNALSVYGFPLLFFGGIFDNDLLTLFTTSTPAWEGIAAFSGLSLISMVGLRKALDQ
ncbi:hypothetical protein B0H94_10410 [Salsuginibacillus halophilus]|uniref:CorA-like Mg2+ transporter protein n=1 Tax=Salsuginibacillus halophilus TaxID=517424 RepID=A0A2P8HQ96_9BACI|nr:hypothetical protein [Salsuginibacillus halophilus]PSL48410.1 hypothetical protein B0H94_10410 [Salsuginibacillus halophilus]